MHLAIAEKLLFEQTLQVGLLKLSVSKVVPHALKTQVNYSFYDTIFCDVFPPFDST